MTRPNAEGRCSGCKLPAYELLDDTAQHPAAAVSEAAREAAQHEISDQQRTVPRGTAVGAYVQRAITAATAAQQAEIAALREERDHYRRLWGRASQAAVQTHPEYPGFENEVLCAIHNAVAGCKERDVLHAELATTRERLDRANALHERELADAIAERDWASERVAKCEVVIHDIWLEVEGYVDGAPDAGEMAGLANRIICEVYKVLSHEALAAQPLDGKSAL